MSKDERLANPSARRSVGKAGESAAAVDGGWRDRLVEFIKFGLVGTVNTGVDILIYTLLLWSGVFYLAAQLVSYTAGTLNSYALNKLWTFKGQGSSRIGSGTGAEFLRFLVLNGATLLLSTILLYACKNGLGLSAREAKVVVTGFTVLANYAGSKLWVFRST